MASLKDPRFEFVDQPQAAQIYWLIGVQRNNYRDSAIDMSGYLNEFPSDSVLLDRNSLMLLMNSCYECYTAPNTQATGGSCALPETYHVQTQLPAFVARYKERDQSFSDNTWAIIDGSLP